MSCTVPPLDRLRKQRGVEPVAVIGTGLLVLFVFAGVGANFFTCGRAVRAFVQ